MLEDSSFQIMDEEKTRVVPLVLGLLLLATVLSIGALVKTWDWIHADKTRS